MFYRIGQRIFASEILGLNQHLFTRLSWNLNYTYTNTKTNHLHLLYIPKRHTYWRENQFLSRQAAVSLYKTNHFWMRMENGAGPSRRIFGGKPTEWGTKLPPGNSARLMGGLLILSGVLQIRHFGGIHKLWWKNQLHTPFVRSLEFIGVDGCQKHHEICNALLVVCV